MCERTVDLMDEKVALREPAGSMNEQERIERVRSRLKIENVMDFAFSGDGKTLDYLENALDILKKNQTWIDENAAKKARQVL